MRIPRPHRSSEESDWVTKATKTITGFVDGLHDTAVVPLTTIVRAIVFGALALIAGGSALVLLSAGWLRLTDVFLDYIPGIPEGVWMAYLVTGAIFVVASLLLWSKRLAK